MPFVCTCPDEAEPDEFTVVGTGNDGNNNLRQMIYDNPDGVERLDTGVYVAWSHFITERVANQNIEVHKILNIGDGSTATRVEVYNEYAIFEALPQIKENGALIFGEVTDDQPSMGTYVKFDLTVGSDVVSLADSEDDVTFEAYGSVIKIDGSGTTKIVTFPLGSILNRVNFFSGNSAIFALSFIDPALVKDVYMDQFVYFMPVGTDGEYESLHINNGTYSIFRTGIGAVSISNYRETNCGGIQLVFNADLTVTDALESGDPNIAGILLSSLTWKRTFDLTITEANGDAVEGADVLLENTQGEKVIDQQTDENGNVSVEVTTFWGSSTAYYPFSLTVTYGERTITKNNILMSEATSYEMVLPPEPNVNSGGVTSFEINSESVSFTISNSSIEMEIS